jgi:hypothetical protein
MEETLQHEKTAQCFRLLTASPRSHHPDSHKAGHPLTFKPDYSMGADYFWINFKRLAIVASTVWKIFLGILNVFDCRFWLKAEMFHLNFPKLYYPHLQK